MKLVWIVNPSSRMARVHRPTGTPPVLAAADTLTREHVIPSFECRVAEFFEI